MDLETLIEELRKRNPNTVVRDGFGEGHTDRGDYMDAAFNPCEETTFGEMLKHAGSLLYSKQQGYKGGTYIMYSWAIVKIGRWGECGEEIGRHHFLYWDGC